MAKENGTYLKDMKKYWLNRKSFKSYRYNLFYFYKKWPKGLVESLDYNQPKEDNFMVFFGLQGNRGLRFQPKDFIIAFREIQWDWILWEKGFPPNSYPFQNDTFLNTTAGFIFRYHKTSKLRPIQLCRCKRISGAPKLYSLQLFSVWTFVVLQVH